MDRFAELTGRAYHLFDYVGAPDAERVIVMMGSGSGAAEEAVAWTDGSRREGRAAEGRLYRPFDTAAFAAALPTSVRKLRRARSDQGAGRDRRAAVPGCGHGTGRSVAG